MEQESVEDLILNGTFLHRLNTVILDGAAKLLECFPETDNSGIEYKSFTEESATEEEYVTPVEVNGLNDETKTLFRSEIVLPRISSTESARGAWVEKPTTFIATNLIQEVKRIESIERDQGLRRKRKKS